MLSVHVLNFVYIPGLIQPGGLLGAPLTDWQVRCTWRNILLKAIDVCFEVVTCLRSRLHCSWVVVVATGAFKLDQTVLGAMNATRNFTLRRRSWARNLEVENA